MTEPLHLPADIRLRLSFATLLALLLLLAAIAQSRLDALSADVDAQSHSRIDHLARTARIGAQAELAARKLAVRIDAGNPEGAPRAVAQDTDDSLIRLAQARNERAQSEAALSLAIARMRDARLHRDRYLLLALCATGLGLGALISAAPTRRVRVR